MNPLAAVRAYLVGALAVVVAGLSIGLAVQTWREAHWQGEALALRRDRDAWTAERRQLRDDIADRDARILAAAGREADSLTTLNRLAAGDVSAAFQKGLAVGRALPHATPSPAPAAGPGAVPGGLPDDYRSLWAKDAFTPGP